MVRDAINKDFGDIFNESLKEYRLNFNLFLKSYFILFLLPLIFFLVIIIGIIYYVVTNLFAYAQYEGSGFDINSLFSITGNAINGSNVGTFLPSMFLFLFLFLFLAIIILSVFSILYYLVIFYITIYNKNGKMNFNGAFRGARKYFWRFIGLILFIMFIFVVMFIPLIIAFMILFFIPGIGILLIILGLIFFIGLYIYLLISWMFSPIILISQNKGIIESMKISYHAVKGMWWHCFGYLFLVFIIMSVVSYSVQFVLGILVRISLTGFENMDNFLTSIILIVIVYSVFIIILISISSLMYTYVIIFLKYLYLDLRNRKMMRTL